MKKNDLLLSDFRNLELQSLSMIKGGAIDTNDCCTDGDVGCCDTDTWEPGQPDDPEADC